MEDLETSWGEVVIMVVVLAVAAVAVIAEVSTYANLLLFHLLEYLAGLFSDYHNMVH